MKKFFYRLIVAVILMSPTILGIGYVCNGLTSDAQQQATSIPEESEVVLMESIIPPEALFPTNMPITLETTLQQTPDFTPEPTPKPTPEPEYVIKLTEQEYWDFCHIVAAESGGEPIEGQIAVAAVIINRIQSPKFPDTFYGVITAKNQFATVKDGKIVSGHYRTYEDIPEKTFEAVDRALLGEDPTEELLHKEAVRLGLDPKEHAEGGALFFYNPKGCSEEALAKREMVKVDFTIKNHVFFMVWPTE